MVRPGEYTKKTMEIGAAYGWYYRVTLIPLIALIAVALIFVSAFELSTVTAVFGSVGGALLGLGYVAAIVLPILFMWVLIPVSIFISAGLYHIIGTWLGQLKGDFGRTLSAVVYSKMPTAIFASALIVLPAAVVLYLVLTAWELIVLLTALSNQQKVKWTVALGVVLITVIVVYAVLGIIFSVFAVAVSGTTNALVNAVIPHLLGNNGYTTPLTYPVS
jgi:hypothetical protein